MAERPLPEQGETLPAILLVPPERSRPLALLIVAIFLSVVVLGTYARIYDPQFGWTKLIDFGTYFAPTALPRVTHHTHYVMNAIGNDGQFYAQMAIDPTVRDPAFDHALDDPVYRTRRIGLSAISYVLGWGKPARVLQAYALSNLLFWFVLLGVSVWLYRPWTGKQIGCLALGLFSFGSLTSLEHSMVDLPATTMVFIGLALSTSVRYAALAGAILTRETNLLAALGFLDLRRPFGSTRWKRELTLLALAILPLALWMFYIAHRFGGLQGATGGGNFSFPLHAMWGRFAFGVKEFAENGLEEAAKLNPFGWLYRDFLTHELLTVVGFGAQVLYLAWRRDLNSPIWRTGICYAALCVILGPAVWGSTFAAARVVLPMTLCFYLLLARERDRWFWPFLVLGSLSAPYAIYEFWIYPSGLMIH